MNSTANRERGGACHPGSEIVWYPDGHYVVETCNGGMNVEARDGVQGLGVADGFVILFDEKHNRFLRMWFPHQIVSVIWDRGREVA